MIEPDCPCSSMELSGIDTLAVLDVAQDQVGIGLAELDSGVDLTFASRDDDGVVVLLDLLVGLEQGIDQVVGLGAGADALQAGPDLSAGAGDRMAFQAREILATEDGLAARRVTVPGDVGQQPGHLGVGQGSRAGFQFPGFPDRGNQHGLVAARTRGPAGCIASRRRRPSSWDHFSRAEASSAGLPRRSRTRASTIAASPARSGESRPSQATMRRVAAFGSRSTSAARAIA